MCMMKGVLEDEGGIKLVWSAFRSSLSFSCSQQFKAPGMDIDCGN